ncbi:MAG TPA: tetratricopeptide repeat-containing sensor histidine kinase [Haliscomenobacter sp.]|uniref:tetratricopeptide repeat-containing sensor histidine kinase n=1 Tax=Haliscomenobacter sp. TaxID=2717303 RepID=UPI002CD4207C|nr:tetratricopeptide repeat-containing sensor histidine kinase [Haliscomenobacter sp.]HOY18920.1 tetratricopeptide repeat-containing sensor histidine kinase [Haliscomenobacter sp.]
MLFCCLYPFVWVAGNSFPKATARTPEIDSLLLLLTQSAPDSNKVLLYKELCWQYRNQDMISAIDYGQKGIALAKKLHFKKAEAEICRFIGLAYRHYFFFRESLDWYFKALDLSTQINDQEGVAFCYDNLGVTRFNQKQFDEALSYFKKGAAIFQKLQHQEGLSYANTHLSWVFAEKKEFDRALDYAERSLRIRRKIGASKEQISNALRDVAVAQIGLNHFFEAEQALLEALKVAKATEKPIVGAEYALSLAELYLKNQNLKQAEYYALWSYRLSVKVDNRMQKMKSAATLFNIYQQKQQYGLAIQYQTEHYRLKDSLFNEDINNNTARLEAKFQFNLKERELLEAQKRQDIENKRSLDRERFLSSLLIAALLFVGIMAYFIYEKRKQDKIVNDELTQKNEEISRQNQEIQEQTEQLAENNRFKDRLFSIISHDLRSPVVGLIGSLDLVNEGLLTETEFRNMLPELSHNVNSIHSLLDNLLAWARSQMKGIAVVPEAFHIRELMEEKIVIFQKQAQLKGLSIVNNIESDIQFLADKNMINLVARNLISNAIKFSFPGGTITLSSSRHKGYSQICIADTGVGISPENLKKLFGAHGISSKGTTGEMGTGLGLMLSKEFIEKNGGTIWVEPNPEGGSRFYFTIPE